MFSPSFGLILFLLFAVFVDYVVACVSRGLWFVFMFLILLFLLFKLSSHYHQSASSTKDTTTDNAELGMESSLVEFIRMVRSSQQRCGQASNGAVKPTMVR